MVHGAPPGAARATTDHRTDTWPPPPSPPAASGAWSSASPRCPASPAPRSATPAAPPRTPPTRRSARTRPATPRRYVSSTTPTQISYQELLAHFFSTHDPTQWNRQGPDVGDQYRSAVFFHDGDQEKAALEAIAQLTESQVFTRPVVTQVVPAASGGAPRSITRSTSRSTRASAAGSERSERDRSGRNRRPAVRAAHAGPARLGRRSRCPCQPQTTAVSDGHACHEGRVPWRRVPLTPERGPGSGSRRNAPGMTPVDPQPPAPAPPVSRPPLFVDIQCTPRQVAQETWAVYHCDSANRGRRRLPESGRCRSRREAGLRRRSGSCGGEGALSCAARGGDARPFEVARASGQPRLRA